MQAYDPQDMFFAKSHIKSWTKEESAKEYNRPAGAYMALRHEHISVLVDQDSKEKNARRQTQTQYTGKAPGSFTPQEAQHILNLHKDDCIKDLKGATLAATGANLEEFGIDETIVTQACDLPGDRSWFEKISDNWKNAARDVLVDSSMDLSIIEEAPLQRQVSFPPARTKGYASDVMFDPLMARENAFDAAQSGFPLTGPKREFLTEPAHDRVTRAPKDEKKKKKLGPEVAEQELKRRIERADTYWVLDVTTEDIQRTTKTLATDCFIPKSSVIMNMAVNSTVKEEDDVYKQDKNKEGEWTDGAKVGLNVAKYTKEFMGLTLAWMLGDVYTREYRKIPALIPRVVKTADLMNMLLAYPRTTRNDIDEKMVNSRT
ncbi:uncharacterized protein J4E92_010313 [Alternaria infectoria]|uniref:uncharacterized protein n=1 Tax=Alternaria infectoria TaxID=45303 RepID=UPI0022208EFA|nr:uncharacterized protein J4E92_010313 [Alternaria infectoria]KAI4911257.1 hypothetical protein J4E92_010313 [Alternaria infectoria]